METDQRSTGALAVRAIVSTIVVVLMFGLLRGDLSWWYAIPIAAAAAGGVIIANRSPVRRDGT